MFWRRKKSDAREAPGGDLAALQKQFGIKTVSDKDVEADLRKLLGETGGLALGLSPCAEQALFGGDDSDEEAAILRQLNLGGDLGAIDVDALAGGEEDDEDAKHELRGLLGDAHRTAQANAARQDVSAIANQRETAREQIHRMKLEAVTLKREGRVQEALAVFREVKTLEAQLARGAEATVTTASAAHVSTSSSRAVFKQVTVAAAAVAVGGADDEDEKDVDVTDEDMENPEFLAQLASLGMPTTKSSKPVETVESLEQAIRESKERAVQLKRSDRIADALAEMRKFKGMEIRLADLRAKSTVTLVAAPPAPAVVAALPIVSVLVLPIESAAEDSDVEVTDEDMNDPAFAAELQKMGFDPSAMGGEGGEDDDETKAEESGTVESLPETRGSQTVLAQQHMLKKRYSLMDDGDLIDEFEDDDDEGDSHDAEEAAGHRADNSTGRSSEDAADSQTSAPASGQGSAIAIAPVEQTAEMPGTGSRVEDLIAQLEHTKVAAVQLKRQGDLQAALEMMRRMKQIEALIEMKQRQPYSVNLPPQPPRVSPEETERLRRFAELEAVLVRYANEATQEAKNQLSINRAKAAEWLARRKDYSAALAVLREKRRILGQDPPFYHIEQLTEQVEVENTDISANEIHLRINSVNDLQQAAGKDIFVKFNMSFPSNAPHEGKTGGLRISTAAPFGSGKISTENFFRLGVQRGRGAQRLFEIKKAVFEVWRPGTILRNPEFIARGYQELAPLLTNCELKVHVPFVGSNRKPVGGDVEISLRLRTPLRDKQYKTLVTEVVRVGEYPPPRVLVQEPLARPASTPHVRPHSQSDVVSVVEAKPAGLPHARSVPTMAVVNTPTAGVTDVVDLEDPHDLDLIVSYDVINDEIERIEAELPNLKGDLATEFSDRLDSLGLKKQLLEIEMQTGKLTLNMYVAKLKQRILDDRAIIKQLMKSGRKNDAKRVLHRVKLMEKELQGTEEDGDADTEPLG